jgi:hypothetical protein
MKTKGRKQNTRHTRRRRVNNLLKNMRGGTATENPVTGTVSVCDDEGNNCWFVVPAILPASSGVNDETKLVWNTFINFFRVGGIHADDLYNTISSICSTSGTQVPESRAQELHEQAVESHAQEVHAAETPVHSQGVATEEQPLIEMDVAPSQSTGNERPGENLLEGGKRRRYRY